jgi:hypothetical protein
MQLKAIGRDLYYPNGDIIVCRYPEGDCDTIRWPKPNIKNLMAALFDDRECGDWDGSIDDVLLPDGTRLGSHN